MIDDDKSDPCRQELTIADKKPPKKGAGVIPEVLALRGYPELQVLASDMGRHCVRSAHWCTCGPKGCPFELVVSVQRAWAILG